MAAILPWAAAGWAQTAPAPSNPSASAAGLQADDQQRCQELLGKARADKNPDVRVQAAQALSLLGPSANNLVILGDMLSDHDVTVRLAVVATLADFKGTGTAPLLEKALHDSVPEVDFAAAKALYQIQNREGRDALFDVASGETKASSGFIKTQTRNYLRMLHTPTKLVLSAAEFAVPVPGFGLGLSSVQGILSDPGSSARAAALLLLGTRNDSSVPDLVQQGVVDKEWSVRAAAAHLIATHPYPQFRQLLIPMLDDKKDPVRLRAAAAYLKLNALPKTAPPQPKHRTRSQTRPG